MDTFWLVLERVVYIWVCLILIGWAITALGVLIQMTFGTRRK